MQAHEICTAVGGSLNGNKNVVYKDICTNTRKLESDAFFVAIKGDTFDGNQFIETAYQKGASVVLGETDYIAPDQKAYIKVEDSIRALGKLAAYHRDKFSMPLVGVTGSVGKTTTKEMLYAVLSQKYNTWKTTGNFNNHIGLPLTVLGLNPSHTAAVIEMGMSARGEISYLTRIAKPTIAVITNIGLSHIENLKTIENIRAAKLEIAEGFGENGILVVNGDDPMLAHIEIPNGKVLRYGFENVKNEIRGTIVGEQSFLVDGKEVIVPIGGRHNLYNALAAYAVGKLCDISAADAIRGISAYQTDGIRQTEKEIRPGITVLCDYYNAGPASMEAAIGMLHKGEQRRTIAVLGDMLELGDYSKACHEEVGAMLAVKGTDVLFTVGKAMRDAAKTAKENGVPLVESFPDNETLANALSAMLQVGDRVLIKGSHGMKMHEIFEKIR